MSAVLALATLLAASASIPAAHAQATPPAPGASVPVPATAPGSGDAWIDAQLADVSRYGARYRDAFIDEVVRYHAAPRDLVTELVVDRRWPPGDVYYACALAHVIGRPCRYVADAWTRDRAGGWGALAQRLDAAPGSEPFMRLKRGFVATYRRWARPLALDAELQREFPRHAGAAGGKDGKQGKDSKDSKDSKDPRAVERDGAAVAGDDDRDGGEND